MSDALPENVQNAMRRGNKIEAIKLLREQSGLGLKEAKEWVEAAQDGLPRPQASAGGAVTRRTDGGGFVPGLMRLYRQLCFVLFVAFFWILLTPGLSFGDAGRWLDRQLASAQAAIGLAESPTTPPAH